MSAAIARDRHPRLGRPRLVGEHVLPVLFGLLARLVGCSEAQSGDVDDAAATNDASTIDAGPALPEPLSVLSGAGGSWIQNLALSDAPLPLRTLGAALMGYESTDSVDPFDLPLHLFQSALAEVEMGNWAVRATRRVPEKWKPRDVLLIAGFIDPGHYPEMISAYALSLGGDLVTPLFEDVRPTAIERLLAHHALIGRGVREPPVSDNVQQLPHDTKGGPYDGTITTVVRDAKGRNGHHVAFGFDDVKQRYACFVATHLSRGRAVVGAPKTSAFASCDQAPP